MFKFFLELYLKCTHYKKNEYITIFDGSCGIEAGVRAFLKNNKEKYILEFNCRSSSSIFILDKTQFSAFLEKLAEIKSLFDLHCQIIDNLHGKNPPDNEKNIFYINSRKNCFIVFNLSDYLFGYCDVTIGSQPEAQDFVRLGTDYVHRSIKDFLASTGRGE